jgi:flagellar biosynthesis GTPase FlhF
MPRAATDRAKIFDNRTWKQHQLLKAELGCSPHRPCPCETDGCTDILIECWGPVKQPYFRKFTKNGKEVEKGGSCGMTPIHATAQAMIAAELNGHKEVKIRIQCKECKRPAEKELRLRESEECRTEAYYKKFNEFYGRDRRHFADLGVVPKGSPKGTMPRLVIEVYQTCRTAEQNRQGVEWFEVHASKVCDQTDAVNEGAVLQLDCMKMLTETCADCEFAQNLARFSSYLQQLDNVFPVDLKKYCVLCDGLDEHNLVKCFTRSSSCLQSRLCPLHLTALYEVVRKGSSGPETFFAEVEAVLEKKKAQQEAARSQAEKEWAKQEAARSQAREKKAQQKAARLCRKAARFKAEEMKKTEQFLTKERLKSHNRLDSQAAEERRAKKLKKTEREDVTMEQIEEHVRRHWDDYRACFVMSHETKLDKVILKLQMEERRYFQVQTNC